MRMNECVNECVSSGLELLYYRPYAWALFPLCTHWELAVGTWELSPTNQTAPEVVSFPKSSLALGMLRVSFPGHTRIQSPSLTRRTDQHFPAALDLFLELNNQSQGDYRE